MRFARNAGVFQAKYTTATGITGVMNSIIEIVQNKPIIIDMVQNVVRAWNEILRCRENCGLALGWGLSLDQFCKIVL